LKIYRIHGDPLGARDFAEWLEMGGASASFTEYGKWTDVRSDASDDLVHEAMGLASWSQKQDGPVMEVLDPHGPPR
jgi:hypothetical protein